MQARKPGKMHWVRVKEIEMHWRYVVHEKTKMYFMYGAGIYERNANRRALAYHHVIATD